MEFIIARDSFIQALSRVSGFVDKKGGNSSILSSVLLQADSTGLRYTGTDKTLTVLGQVAATVSRPGEAAVDASNLLTIVKAISGDTVHCTSVDGQRLEVRAGASTFRLTSQPGGEFPVTPPLDQSRSLRIAPDALARILDQTLFSVAGDDNRYGLNGAHFEQVTAADGSTMLRVVATDGNRLSWSQAPFTGELAIGRKSLVPRKGLVEVRRLLEGVKSDVEIAFGERAAVVRLDDCTIHMRLLEADFPDYRQVLPNAFKRKAVVTRVELSEALKRVLIFAQDSSRSVKFACAEDTITLSSRKLDAGESKEEVRMDLQGEPITMGFNGRFLQEVLSVISSERVLLELGDTLSPCIVKSTDSADALFVVMPVRLD
jgi:DNA polymerase-3 subunit beta